MKRMMFGHHYTVRNFHDLVLSLQLRIATQQESARKIRFNTISANLTSSNAEKAKTETQLTSVTDEISTLTKNLQAAKAEGEKIQQLVCTTT